MQLRHPSPSTLRPFRPHPWVRSARAQTLLARWTPRSVAALRRLEQPVLLDAGRDVTGMDPAGPVRLLGYYVPRQMDRPSRGLVLTLHGWEGCSHSSYNLVLCRALVQAGYDVFRLNLRDHGPGYHVDPHALNPGLFLGTLLDEVAVAVGRVAEMAGRRPFCIVGASLGGNFALRLAIRHRATPFPNLRRVVAICPAVNPARASDNIDAHRDVRFYFRRRWVRSLLAKQRLFPERYDFGPLLKLPRLREMTEWLVRHYTPYRDADDYFRRYTVHAALLQRLTVPTTIIATADDTVIPVVDLQALPPHPLLDLQIYPVGGHVGFVDLFPFKHCLPDLLLAALARDRAEEG